MLYNKKLELIQHILMTTQLFTQKKTHEEYTFS